MSIARRFLKGGLYVKTEVTKAKQLKIAYIGGGSRGWAWGLMSDLAAEKELAGQVYLYDIDLKAAKANETIGNSIPLAHPDAGNFSYKAVETLKEALVDADFVVISILPGTFDEMQSDVHAPEKYGIYQSVGDTTGPGGVLRALRTIPMFEVFANAVRQYCPQAWVINYTNPMAVCIRTLYRVFPQIKAFGCCHEVFGTQQFLANVAASAGLGEIRRQEIKVNVVGVNHFTWFTAARYQDKDLFPVYRAYCLDENRPAVKGDENWLNRYFLSQEKVKMDLFLRYGAIAAAGDRHLAEFCPGKWYLKDPETAYEQWGFRLTPVSWRKEELKQRLARSSRLLSGEEVFALKETGEEGVLQMKALLGLGDLVTNVNLPNRGQIGNLPHDAVVETNASFTANGVTPVFAGDVPCNLLTLVAPVVANQECTVEAGLRRDLETAFAAFVRDPLMTVSAHDAKMLFDEMVDNTSAYLTEYLK